MNSSLTKSFTFITRPSSLFKARHFFYVSSRFASQTKNGNTNEPDPMSHASLKGHNWLIHDPSHIKSLRTHKSLAEQNIHKIPVIYADHDVVRCIGGTEINTGHPQVYIQLNTRDPSKPSVCKYCGLKFMRRHGHEHHGGHAEGHEPGHH